MMEQSDLLHSLEKRVKVNSSQWKVFLDFAEINPIILTKRFEGLNNKKRYDELWREVSNILNSMGFIKKSVEKWQKAIADWKSKVKGKAAEINKSLQKTGGGPPVTPLNVNEERLMALLGWTIVTGIENVTELGFAKKAKEVNKPLDTTVEGNSLPPLIPLFGCTSSSPGIMKDTEFDFEFQTISIPNIQEHEYSLQSGEIIGHETNTTEHTRVEKTPPKECQSEKKHRYKRQKVPASTPRSTPKTIFPTKNMEQMHEDTLSILKDINENLRRMSDTQERLCNLIERMLEQNIHSTSYI